MSLYAYRRSGIPSGDKEDKVTSTENGITSAHAIYNGKASLLSLSTHELLLLVVFIGK